VSRIIKSRRHVTETQVKETAHLLVIVMVIVYYILLKFMMFWYIAVKTNSFNFQRIELNNERVSLTGLTTSIATTRHCCSGIVVLWVITCRGVFWDCCVMGHYL